MGILTAGGIIRRAFAVLTIVSAPIGFLSGDERWFTVSAAFGAIWWAWDVLDQYVFAPLGSLAARLLAGDVDLPSLELRPTLEDTVRLLQSHIEQNASREVQIQAAQRLADIYRGVYRDESRALEVIATVRARFPDAAELDRES